MDPVIFALCALALVFAAILSGHHLLGLASIGLATAVACHCAATANAGLWMLIVGAFMAEAMLAVRLATAPAADPLID